MKYKDNDVCVSESMTIDTNKCKMSTTFYPLTYINIQASRPCARLAASTTMLPQQRTC